MSGRLPSATRHFDRLLRVQELQAIQAGEPARARYTPSQGNESAGVFR